MKLWRYTQLAKANSRRSKRGGSVFILLLLSVLSLMLITSYTVTLQYAMDGFKNQDPARRLVIETGFTDLGMQVLTPELIKKVGQIEHVQSVDMNDGMEYQFFKINAVSNEKGDNCTDILPVSPSETSVEAWSLYKTQKMKIIAGKQLDDSPVFSCLVPNSFCLVNNYDVQSNEKEEYMQNGEDYLGKTLTIVPATGSYESIEYKESGGVYLTQWDFLPAIEYKLNVVGVYYASYDGRGGNPNTIFVSNETGRQIEQMAVNATNSDIYMEEYYEALKRTDLHSFTVLVDNAENVDDVRKALEGMKIDVSSYTQVSVPEDVGLFATVFTAAGNFFTIAVLLLTVINLFLATSSGLLERKGEIGLLKAIGYKNRQIFLSLYMEQLKTGLRAFAVGGILSAACVAVMNLINANGPFAVRIYVVSWLDFALLSLAALLLTTIVPLLCELVMVRSLTKISPREAMAPQ